MLRYWTGIINGIALEESAGEACGFQIIGAEAFESSYTGNTVAAADGYPQTQVTPLYTYGKVIEVRFIHIPGTLLRTLLTLLAGGIVNNTSYPCTFSDGFQTIIANFKPHVPDWYKRGEPDGSYIKDAVLTLISTGA